MTLSEKAGSFVFNLLKDKLSASYTYHNFEHTERVVKAAETMLPHFGLDEEERTAIRLAAWFHDTGYVSGPDDHEARSVALYDSFALENGIPEEISARVRRIILATNMASEPQTLPEKIIRDADCSHFGSAEYPQIAASLRKEWESQDRHYSDLQWCSGNLDMLTRWHRFFTDYAKTHWQPQKERNIADIKEKIARMEHTAAAENPMAGNEKKKGKKKNKPDRGIETMFRVTLNNHTQLSQIADSKANILLSVNAIIISIALSTLIPKLDSPGNAHLIAPTFIMLLFSVISIIFAILATRPKINTAAYDKADVTERRINLLFFGNFSKMPHEDYQQAMKEMMADTDFLYESLIRDLYYLGIVLDRKYKLLRITYNIFMLGIISSVAAFVVAFQSV